MKLQIKYWVIPSTSAASLHEAQSETSSWVRTWGLYLGWTWWSPEHALGERVPRRIKALGAPEHPGLCSGRSRHPHKPGEQKRGQDVCRESDWHGRVCFILPCGDMVRPVWIPKTGLDMAGGKLFSIDHFMWLVGSGSSLHAFRICFVPYFRTSKSWTPMMAA